MTALGLGLGSAVAPLGIPGTTSFLATTVHTEVMTQGIGIDPDDVSHRGFPLTITELPAIADDQTISLITNDLAEDVLRVTYLISSIRARVAVVTQGIGTAPVLSGLQGVVLVEDLEVALAQITNHNARLTLSEMVEIASAMSAGRPVTLTEGVGLELSQQSTLALQIIEELGLLPVLTPILRHGITTTEGLAIATQLLRFIGAETTQGMGVGLNQSSTARRSATLSQGVGVALDQIPRLLINVSSTEDIGIEDIDVLQMLFNPVLAQGIEITAAYLAPDGGLTAWAMNTRTAGVTEYDNFEFNSFGVLGGRSIGATSAGLYELTGDDDAGDAIIARIKSGFMQFGGTKLSSLKAAYLATRGDAGFVLRIETGQGELYNYAVSTRDMRSTKVHMGKGLRARYFSFELISTGADFDIDTLEFVPIVMARRV